MTWSCTDGVFAGVDLHNGLGGRVDRATYQTRCSAIRSMVVKSARVVSYLVVGMALRGARLQTRLIYFTCEVTETCGRIDDTFVNALTQMRGNVLGAVICDVYYEDFHSRRDSVVTSLAKSPIFFPEKMPKRKHGGGENLG